MSRYKSKFSASLQHCGQLSSFLVNTREILLDTRKLFEYDGQDSSSHQEIERAVRAIDIAGRDIDKKQLDALYQRRFSS